MRARSRPTTRRSASARSSGSVKLLGERAGLHRSAIATDGQVATATPRGTTTPRASTKTFDYDPATLNELGGTDTVGRSMACLRDAAGDMTRTFDGTATTIATYDANNRVIETRGRPRQCDDVTARGWKPSAAIPCAVA